MLKTAHSPIAASSATTDSFSPALESHAQPVRDNSLRMISMRVQKDVISQLKAIAARKGIGYQPYIRMLLTEHIARAGEGR